MKHLIISFLMAGSAAVVSAEIPAGYYYGLDNRSGAALVTSIKALGEGHTVVTYSTKTWGVFETTDVREISGRKVWWDMYSNNIVYLPEHAALNIEHAVAKSWWGGKDGSVEAYSDMFHLNPSDQSANNAKSNYPPAEVVDARLFDNGMLRVGTPAKGQGGGSGSAFEPADEFKGDFARAYFYVFTTYADIPWRSDFAFVYGADGKLQTWALELLLKWHREDPVDSKEIARNEGVYASQGNRNPFIDYPQLAEYVWGDKAGTAFSLSAESVASATDRPAAPVFEGMWLVGVNTYAGRWWNGKEIDLSHDGGRLMVSIDGAEYVENYDGKVVLDPAGTAAEKHSFRAYVENEVDGKKLRSPIASLSMAARDAAITDYSAGRWEKVTSLSDMSDSNELYIILSSNTLHIMSAKGGTSSNAFMSDAGFVAFEDDDVVELPVEAALVRFEPVAGGKSRMKLYDIYGDYKGSWNASGKNKMKLDAVTYTAGVPDIKSDGTFVYTFEQNGRLQYNGSTPRFLNYESPMKPVYVYRLKSMDGGWSGIEVIEDKEEWGVGIGSDGITIDEGCIIYDLSGRRVEGRGLGKGIYIVVGPDGIGRKVSL